MPSDGSAYGGKRTALKKEKTQRGHPLADAHAKVTPRLRRIGAQLDIEAEDVAQDACVRVLRMEQPDSVQAPVAFLLRVARNLFVDRQRARAREATLFCRTGDLEHQPGETADPERILAGKQRLAVALDAIGRLPPRCREAFMFHRFDGLGYTAIARRMGISTSMVEKHIATAMSRLEGALRAAGEAGPGA
jgi:RNA polymerase sigma factor (sigma-70 family)